MQEVQMNEILELIEQKQYSRLRQELAEWNEADIAAIFEELPKEELIVA